MCHSAFNLSCVVRTGFDGSWRLVYTIYSCPEDNSDEWIEYIPEPRPPERERFATCRHGNELSECDACDGGCRDR